MERHRVSVNFLLASPIDSRSELKYVVIPEFQIYWFIDYQKETTDLMFLIPCCGFNETYNTIIICRTVFFFCKFQNWSTTNRTKNKSSGGSKLTENPFSAADYKHNDSTACKSASIFC